MDEKMQILKMIEEGKITAEEGMKLMEALNQRSTDIITYEGKAKPKWIKVRITEPSSESKVKINLPVSIVEFGLKMGIKFSPELAEFNGLDIQHILEEIQNGAEGKIVEIEGDNGEIVEVYVE